MLFEVSWSLAFSCLTFFVNFQVFVENGFLSSISKPYNYWHVSTITEKSILLPNSILRFLEKSDLKTALLSASAMRVTVVDLSYVWRWEKIRRNWRKNKKGFWCFFSISTIFNNLAERLYIFCFVKNIIWFLGGHWLFSLKNNLICFKILSKRWREKYFSQFLY